MAVEECFEGTVERLGPFEIRQMASPGNLGEFRTGAPFGQKFAVRWRRYAVLFTDMISVGTVIRGDHWHPLQRTHLFSLENRGDEIEPLLGLNACEVSAQHVQAIRRERLRFGTSQDILDGHEGPALHFL